MDIEFCDCGGMLIPTGNKARCRSCGKTVEKKIDVRVISKAEKNDIAVVEDNTPDRLPDTLKTCPKCGNERAYWWLIQTRASDEPPTQFFRCTKEKCKHTWREYK